MVKTMKKTKHFLGRIVNGELDAEPDEKQCRKKDELGDVYRISVKLQKTLRSIVTEIKDSADDLTASSNKLIKMAQDTQESVNDVYHAVGEISDGARNQANETTDANENVVRIGEQIEYISEEVKSLTDYAGRMAEAEKASEEIMKELNGSNESTKESVLRVAEQITDMNGAIQNITKAVSMIQDIADETDLLSLNASIEAARAGEAGRGFAVVAEQISKLADQSKRSATEIEQIIQNIMESSGRMVEIMGEVEANMNHQQSKLEETGVKTAAVADGVENSLQHIGGIREKMDVLGQSGSAIRDVVEGLSAISEQNAASADSTMQAAHGMSDTMTELMNSSENLLALADKLEKVLDVFKV
jgi:methyl-accepting chemotaxis protein